MLAKAHRITRGTDYRSVVRRGQRCAAEHTVTYVVHAGDAPPRFGLIVGRQVGTAVVRNRVRRRLKAVCAHALPSVREGASVVVRALPGAADAAYAELDAEVSACLARRAAR